MAEHHGFGYEKRDTNLRALGKALFWLAVLIVGALVAMWVLLSGLLRYDKPTARPLSPLAAERVLPGGPRLQPNPPVDLVAWRAREEAVLQSYGWVDREAGVVRLPIEWAMALIVERSKQ